MSASSARRVTLTDVLVVLLVLVPMAGGYNAYLVAKAREPAYRVRCASNLRQIGQGLQMYANENKGNFPRARYDGQGATPTEYSRPQSADPFGADGPGPNDVTAALFLLLRTQDLSSESFLCPTAASGTAWDYGGRPVAQVSNFPGRQYLGYSYINPYPTPAAMAAGFKVNHTLTSDFAIAADMNPGGAAVVSVNPQSPRPQMAAGNSRNHNGDGQNVLFADGGVEFHNTPFCGMLRNPGPPNQFRDNIYTYGASHGAGSGVGVRGSPVDALDSILLPTAPDGPAPVVGASPQTLLLRGVGATVVLGIVLALLFGLRRKKPVAVPSAE